ncbi:MAG: hypothetical protein HY678_12330, partial [Chloroflexi bacterium]|nr:hypothetical protein [Chloroflexota bacterium]
MTQAPRPSIIAAPLGPGFIRALRGAIDDAKRRDPLGPVTVVTPSVYSAYYLRRAFAADGLFNVRFTRLEDLAEELADLSDLRPPMTRLVAAELVYSVATQLGDRLAPDLQRHRSDPSFHEALHRTFSELENAPHEIVAGLGASGHDRGIVHLFNDYLRLSAGFLTRGDVARSATKAVRASNIRIGAGTVVLGLVETPALEYLNLVRALLERAHTRAVVAIAGEGPVDRPLLEACGIGRARVPGDTPAAGLEPASIVSLSDPAAEAAWVVRNVVALVKEGARFSDIAVLCASPSYGRRIDDALRLAGIPVSGPDPRSLADTPDGRFLLGLFAVFGAGNVARAWRREEVAGWFTGAPLRSPDGTGIHAARWDAVSRRAGVTTGLETWRGRLPAYAQRLEARAERGLAYGEIDEGQAGGIRREAAEARSLLSFIEDAARHAPPPDGSSWAAFSEWAANCSHRYISRPDGTNGATEQVRSVLERIAGMDRAA